MATAFILGPEAEEAARVVVDHSLRRENWYCPELKGVLTPGDNEDHVLILPSLGPGLGGVRCVFSITVMLGGFWRHLSMSVRGCLRHGDGGCLLPFGIASLLARELFGFERAATEWQGGADVNHGCVVLAEQFVPPQLEAVSN